MAHFWTRRGFTRHIGPTLFVGGSALWGAKRVWAFEVAAEVSARVSAPTIRVGEPVQLSLELKVRGARAPGTLPWPDALVGAFEVSNVTSAGGWSGDLFAREAERVYTRQTTALITAKESGTYSLGFSIEIGGQMFESNAPTLTVLEADAELPSSPPRREPTEASGPVFLWAAVDKEVVYVGEQLTYSLDVYERRSFLGIHLRKPPSFIDFFTEELPEGESVIKTVGTVEYRVRPGLRRALFAQRSGTLEIGSAELSVGGRQRILSRALKVEVRPLPAEDQPAGFSPNNVGRFEITAQIDRTTVNINEPLTLRVVLSGEGNVKFLDPGPWPEIEGMRRYEPKVETRLRKGLVLGGERSYEFLLIPQHGGSMTIPAHELAFFDPGTERYEVVRTKPIEVNVQGSTTTEPEAESGVETRAEDLAAPVLGQTLTRHAPRNRWLTPTRWLYGMLAMPAVAAVGWGAASLRRRWNGSEAAQIKARRRERHRQLIEEAEQAVESGDGFHAALSKLLHDIAVERAGSEGVGVPRPELLRILGQQGMSPTEVERLRDLLDRCDAARFGAQGDTPQERQGLLEEVLDLVRTSRVGKEAS